jgi:hypothetical protein
VLLVIFLVELFSLEFLFLFLFSETFEFSLQKKQSRMSRIIDYSKWDTLNYSSSSSSEEEDEKARATIARLGHLLLSSSRRTSSSSPLWNGLVLHHKDVFVSHVIPKLNLVDRFFFSEVNRESRGVLEYAGVNVSGLGLIVYECSSISTLEWAWNHLAWGKKDGERGLQGSGSESEVGDMLKRISLPNRTLSAWILPPNTELFQTTNLLG